MIRDGVFTAVEPWKCKHCTGKARRKRTGTKFVVYTPPGDESWIGCFDCAGIYAELAVQPVGQ